MTRDEIYDHLAQVYLGKRKEAEKKKKRQFNSWLMINVLITLIIFASVFYGLTAFLTQRKDSLQGHIIFSIHNGPLQVAYNFRDSASPITTFSLDIPQIDIEKYQKIHFAIRAKEEGSPGVVKIVFKNQRQEMAEYYVRGVDLEWQEFYISLEDFKEITDWTGVSKISFVLESWNVKKDKGIILIDDVYFSS